MQVQGGSRRTWSYGPSPGPSDSMHVEIGSDGRPVDAEFELWQGPGNTPVKTRLYGDDGYSRPVYATIGTESRYRRWGANTASIRNKGPIEFPVNAQVGRSPFQQGVADAFGSAQKHRIQGGGALRTFTIDGSIGSAQVLLQSEGMPISAKIEILQGPNSDRQGIDLYSDDGRGKPVSYLLELPGYGSTISIKNMGPMEYPLTASVVPYGPQRMEPDEYGYGNGAYGGAMQQGTAYMSGIGRYGSGDRYGRDGLARRSSEAQREIATGRKWHERGARGNGAPRGPPPSFAEAEREEAVLEAGMQRGYPPGMMMGPGGVEFDADDRYGYGYRGYGAPPRRAYPPGMY